MSAVNESGMGCFKPIAALAPIVATPAPSCLVLGFAV